MGNEFFSFLLGPYKRRDMQNLFLNRYSVYEMNNLVFGVIVTAPEHPPWGAALKDQQNCNRVAVLKNLNRFRRQLHTKRSEKEKARNSALIDWIICPELKSRGA